MRVWRAVSIGALALLGAIGATSCGGTGGEDPTNLPGTWRLRGDIEEISFRADGSLTVTDGSTAENVYTGTWSATTEIITLTAHNAMGGGYTGLTLSYALRDSRLMLGALRPEGSTDGVVGTWNGDSKWGILRIEVRADGSASFAASDESGQPFQNHPNATYTFESASGRVVVFFDKDDIGFWFTDGLLADGVYDRQ